MAREYHLRLPEELYEALWDLADREGRSVHRQILHLLSRAVEVPPSLRRADQIGHADRSAPRRKPKPSWEGDVERKKASHKHKRSRVVLGGAYCECGAFNPDVDKSKWLTSPGSK